MFCLKGKLYITRDILIEMYTEVLKKDVEYFTGKKYINIFSKKSNFLFRDETFLSFIHKKINETILH